MKHLFKSDLIKQLMIVLSTILIVKIIWFAVMFMWLPTSGVEHIEEQRSGSLYYRARLSQDKKPQPVQETRVIPKASIKDIDLLGIYSASDITVVTVRHKRKTKVLSRGDAINGFVLEGAGSNYATFSKSEKLYKLTLIKPKAAKQGTGSIRSVGKTEQSTSNKQSKKEVSGEIVDVGDRRLIDKSLVTHYANNMDDIFKDIRIKDLKKDDKLTGFRVSFIRKGSNFAKLGLKRGDVIKSINGQEVKSYNVAFDIYKNIKNIENMTLVILRDNKEMELEYEVN